MCAILFDMYYGIPSDIHSGILSDPFLEILSGILFDIYTI